MNSAQVLQERWEEVVRRAQASPTYGLEGLLLAVSERICEAMERKGISRADLAEKLGVSRPWVTKLLTGNRNLTLKSLVCVANALDLCIDILLLEKVVGYSEETMTLGQPALPGYYVEDYEASDTESQMKGTNSYALAA